MYLTIFAIVGSNTSLCSVWKRMCYVYCHSILNIFSCVYFQIRTRPELQIWRSACPLRRASQLMSGHQQWLTSNKNNCTILQEAFILFSSFWSHLFSFSVPRPNFGFWIQKSGRIAYSFCNTLSAHTHMHAFSTLPHTYTYIYSPCTQSHAKTPLNETFSVQYL